MTRLKTTLFLATVASGALLASAAQAQTNIAAPASNDGETVLHGAGASSIQNVLVQELNCLGATNYGLGLSTGATPTPITEPTDLPYSGGTFNCTSDSLEPAFAAKYVATGSGFGKTAWTTAAGNNPFTGSNVNPFGTWTSVQYAFSDSNISSGDITTYTNNVATAAGPAVFFPKYVLPVAVAYNPAYGTNGSVAMNFNVTSPKSILGVTAGGLQLNASTYCEIFNGYIVNWNDAAITADNGGTPLFDTISDTSTRWTDEGAPIRLVGRVDRSGTTDIFTRHLAAVCSLKDPATNLPVVMVPGHTNKFASNAETLPYSRGVSGTPDFASVRSDTGLSASSTAGTAGTVNSVSNTYFINTASGFGTVSSGSTFSGAPVRNGTLLNGSGLFIVANGSGGVTNAINYPADVASSTAGILLNGKIGYIGSDFVAPAPNASLFSAALKGTAGASSNPNDYKMPSAAEGKAAFGTAILPPQTNGTTGNFAPGSTARGLRSNPLAWTTALYAAGSTLANPGVGYPITGTTQFAGYTCYKAGNANAIRNFLGWNMQTITTNSSGNSRDGVFTDDVGATVSDSGLLARSNIGVMPDKWQGAIDQAFLSGSDGLGLTITDVSTAASGSVCSGKTGR